MTAFWTFLCKLKKKIIHKKKRLQLKLDKDMHAFRDIAFLKELAAMDHGIYAIHVSCYNNVCLNYVLSALPSVESTFSHASAPPSTSSTSFNFGYCRFDIYNVTQAQCHVSGNKIKGLICQTDTCTSSKQTIASTALMVCAKKSRHFDTAHEILKQI